MCYGDGYSRRPIIKTCFTNTMTDKDLLVLTDEEQKSLDDFCSLYNELIELKWIRNAYISY
jgi:hypothetical protein